MANVILTQSPKLNNRTIQSLCQQFIDLYFNGDIAMARCLLAQIEVIHNRDKDFERRMAELDRAIQEIQRLASSDEPLDVMIMNMSSNGVVR